MSVCIKVKLLGVVVEVTLNVDDRGTLVAAAGGQVAQRADEVGEPSRGRALGCHLTLEVAVLFLDLLRDSCLELIAGEICKIIVGKVLELQLVGSTGETCGVTRGNNRVSQLPDLAHRILECAVAVDEHFNGLTGLFKHELLHTLNEFLAVDREQLNGVLGSLIGTQQTAEIVVAAAVYGCGEDVVKAVDGLGTVLLEQALCAGSGVDIAAQHILGVVEDGRGLVCEMMSHSQPQLSTSSL